jgi:ATP-dependent helicase/nuclease subunit A
MSKSWRSSPAIMRFVNLLFDETPLGALLEDFETHDTHHHDLWGRVEVLPLVPKADKPEAPEPDPDAPIRLRDPLETPRPYAEDDTAYREGQAIARRIRALIDAGVPVGAAGKARRLRYDDIMILLRNRTASEHLERALREAGIPFLGSERGGLLEALEIQDLLALLELLVTPFDNLRLAQVLKSPLFDATDADLVALAQTEGKYWLERLGTLVGTGVASPALAVAHRQLSAWQPLAGALPIHDLLDHIYTQGDVIARYRAATPEDQRPTVLANLTRFVELALEVDAGRYPSLIKFLDRLRQLRAGSDEAPDAPPSQGVDARVRIMTVHGSKGLEAPVVILADATAPPNDRGTYAPLVDWPVDAEHPELFMLRGKKADIDSDTQGQIDRAQERNRREDANLLYVAVTRARQMLIVSGHERSKGKEENWYVAIEAAVDGQAEANDDGAWVLEHGEPPEIVATEAAAPEAVTVPPGLDRKLRTPPSPSEIAPSRQVGTGGLVEAEDEDGLARGIAIHRALELLTSPNPPDADTLAARIAAELALSARRHELDGWIAEAMRALDDPAFADVMRPDATFEARNELPILYQQNGRRVYGMIDRLLVGANRLILVDYKTHRVDALQCEALAAHYAPQLKLYAEGLHRLWPERRIDARLLFTHAGRQVAVDLEGA